MSQQQTLQQRRATHAWAQVGERPSGEYVSLVRGLPSMIQSEGLATSLTFLRAKGKSHHKDAYRHIQLWIQKEFGTQEDLLKFVLSLNSNEYRRVASEILAYIGWLKRFSEASGVTAKEDKDR
jgi:CRISPR type III-B/RAMP module-associated protein Cmr5